MSTQVTITLPDDVYDRAERLAQFADRKVADLLADTVALSLTPCEVQLQMVKPVTELSDEEVLALTALQMEADHAVGAVDFKAVGVAVSDGEAGGFERTDAAVGKLRDRRHGVVDGAVLNEGVGRGGGFGDVAV